MSKQKLTPMSEDDIKTIVEFLLPDVQSRKSKDGTLMALNLARHSVLCLILAWIHERAAKERAEWQRDWSVENPHIVEREKRTDADWIAAVKERVGWKEP